MNQPAFTWLTTADSRLLALCRVSSAAKHQDEWLNPGPPSYRQGASALYFGGFGDQPITGDWDDSGIDTMAVVR